MNKYFLSFVSILMLFQGFNVFDEIFFKKISKKDKGYKIIESTELKKEFEEEENKEQIDLDLLLEAANIEKGVKISKQFSSCHNFSKKLKLKIGLPLWGIVNRKSANISNSLIQRLLLILKRYGLYKNFIIF